MNPHIFRKPPSRKGLFIFSLILAGLAAGLILLNLSCSTAPQPVGGLGGASQAGLDSDFSRDDYEDEDSYDRDRDRRASPRSSRSRRTLRKTPRYQCKSGSDSGDACADDDECIDICDDLFSKKGDKADCQELNAEVVEDFDNIFSILEEGEDFESIDYDNLDCLLKISDTAFVKEARKLKGRQAKQFLRAIAENEGLAEVLNRKDDDHKIFQVLLSAALPGSDDEVLKSFREDIDGGDSLFDIIVDSENEDAWWYAMDYVSNLCEDDSYCDPRPKSEVSINNSVLNPSNQTLRELVFFCKTYFDKRNAEIDALMLNTFFIDEYNELVTHKYFQRCGAAAEADGRGAGDGAYFDDASNQIPQGKCTLKRAHFIAADKGSDNIWHGSICRFAAGKKCYDGGTCGTD